MGVALPARGTLAATQREQDADGRRRVPSGTAPVRARKADFQISETYQEKVTQFPVKVEPDIDRFNEDLIPHDKNKELTVYLPLLNNPQSRLKNPNQIIITPIGDDRWLEYDRRVCSKNTNKASSIIGKEYLIEEGGKVSDSVIPMLEVKEDFSFAN